MFILSVETSCDDTCVAVIEVDESKGEFGKVSLLSDVVSSQVDIHRKYGGIVPNLASRKHLENIRPVFDQAVEEAGLRKEPLQDRFDLIAVTRGPGLIPSLLVGVSFTKALAWKWELPLLGVNHLEGHLYSNFLEIALAESQKPKPDTYFPALSLVVSGGHTQLILLKGIGEYELLGETRDDAAGEAFDKVARLLGLGYPGGPEIEKEASQGHPSAYDLPRPMENSGDYDFSFSGLKTAVSRCLKNNNLDLEKKSVLRDLAASFQKAAVDVLVEKTLAAAREYRIENILLSGGVAANNYLRTELKEATKGDFRFLAPAKKFCTDNAAMTGFAGWLNWHSLTTQEKKLAIWNNLQTDPNLSL